MVDDKSNFQTLAEFGRTGTVYWFASMDQMSRTVGCAMLLDLVRALIVISFYYM